MGMNTDRFRVRFGDHGAITRHDASYTAGLRDKAAAREHLHHGILHLEQRLELLHAQAEHALLLIFQGMDASGKDGAIKHVMSGVNPIFTEVHAFKQPSSDELAHDFLWRASRALPARGTIGIFDRSYYEDVIVVRVHPEILATQRLPPDRRGPRIWQERFEDIRAFERRLWRNGTTVRKFFFHVSRPEQQRRLLQRFDDPTKNWKFSARDVREREHWNSYMGAYREALAATSSTHAPWYVIPADHKWFARLLVAEIITKTLDGMALKAPTLSPTEKRGLMRVRRELAAGSPLRPPAVRVRSARPTVR
jgi:PPK2 family polyphosphate:nucleotide phosphotransferase